MRRPPNPGSVVSSSFAPGATSATYVTALPSNPVDGQQIYYAADATNGVIWHLRYRSGSSSSYKWEFVGGVPKQTPTSGDITTTSTTYVEMTSGPQLTVPINGEYDVELVCLVVVTSTGNNPNMQATVGTSTAKFACTAPSGNGNQFTYQERITLATTDTLKLYVSNANGVSSRFVNARFNAIPVRVG